MKDISGSVYKLEGISKVEANLKDQLVSISGTGSQYQTHHREFYDRLSQISDWLTKYQLLLQPLYQRFKPLGEMLYYEEVEDQTVSLILLCSPLKYVYWFGLLVLTERM